MIVPEPNPWAYAFQCLSSQAPGKGLDAASGGVGRDGGSLRGRSLGGESSSARHTAKSLRDSWRGEAESALSLHISSWG